MANGQKDTSLAAQTCWLTFSTLFHFFMSRRWRWWGTWKMKVTAGLEERGKVWWWNFHGAEKRNDAFCFLLLTLINSLICLIKMTLLFSRQWFWKGVFEIMLEIASTLMFEECFCSLIAILLSFAVVIWDGEKGSKSFQRHKKEKQNQKQKKTSFFSAKGHLKKGNEGSVQAS